MNLNSRASDVNLQNMILIRSEVSLLTGTKFRRVYVKALKNTTLFLCHISLSFRKFLLPFKKTSYS